MKKIYNALFIALASASLAACGGGDDPTPTPNPDPTPEAGDVEVTISTTDIETKAAITQFASGHKMNIFAKTYQRIDAPNIVDGVIASYDGTKWVMNPPVYINATGQKNAFVYAVAPYDEAYTDAQNIPVDLNKQVDLMYSGAYVPASTTSPQVKLTMKHALSLLTFNIVSQNASGKLSQIKIEGDIVYSTGKMDASTGKITLGDKGAVTAKCDKTTQEGGWKSDLPGVWALPFNTKTGVANITFTIDGVDYALEIPEVEVKTGWQYIFRLVLTKNGLEFDPSQTETISLNVDTDEAKEFVGYGLIVLKACGTWLNIPNIFGDAVFGSIGMPAGTQPYRENVKVEGLKEGDKVNVESWNSTGFKIVSLDNVDEIDLSDYE